MDTNSLISKIGITFQDGSFLELVDHTRLIRIRDNLKTLSEANNMLNSQMQSMERKIEELQEENKKLNDLNQLIINAPFIVSASVTEFENPLP